MEALQLKVVLRILNHAGIHACVVGELALNYYNVPRVLHVIELCVPENSVNSAASILCRTGLFSTAEIIDFDIYNEYKRGCPRLQSTSWITPTYTLILLSDRSCGLEPLIKHRVCSDKISSSTVYSSQILDIIPSTKISNLPLPLLPSLLAGLCRRFLDFNDDIAMIAAEQLVDGMDLDAAWCERNLRNAESETQQLVARLNIGKKSCIDDFSENTVNCFIATAADAKLPRQIPGYE